MRFSDEIWALLERRARAEGLTLHAALRQAILEWARHAA
ncbi:MAG TPA: ribbon-helix-helix protein, CopG family [Solirubrobacteraceae bacterium]|nr:ribbon-helix-helix protein, CopG family [Solirubrobacteraceae bacterium]